VNIDSEGVALSLRRAAVFFLAGSFVNDLVLLEGVTPLSLAKLLFLVGFGLLFLFGLSVRQLGKIDVLVMLYAGGLVFLSALPANGYANDYAASIALSLGIGLVAHLVIACLKHEDLRFFLSSYVIWMLFSAGLGVVQAATGAGHISERAFESIVVPGVWRAAGLSSDPNYFALMCLMALVILNAMLEWRRFRFAASVILSIAVLLSGSRAGILVYMLMVMIWTFSALRLSWFLRLLAVAVGAAALFWLASLNPALGLIFDAGNYTEAADRTSLQDRGLLAALALDVFRTHPWLGAGLGSVRAHELNLSGSVSHNAYLEIGAESGLVGLTLWLGLLMGLYVALSRVERDRSALGGRWLVVVFALMSLTLVTGSTRLFFLVSGVASCYVWHARAKSVRERLTA
jgi:O-antigen ligase